MAFSDLEVEELLNVAEYFGVEVEFPQPAKGKKLSKAKQKETVIFALNEFPVSWDDYKRELGTKSDSDEVEEVVVADRGSGKRVAPEDGVLLWMKDRDNPRFDIRGYTFTRDHPFAVVTDEDARFIMSIEHGFRPALPSEMEEYYKGKKGTANARR